MVLSRFLSIGLSHLIGAVSAGSDLARGWGNDVMWLTLNEGRNESQTYGKPMMVIVHKTGCQACARVKPLFARHGGVQSLCRHFAMVNLEPNEVPHEIEFEPDGAYVPRFLFFSPEGRTYLDINGNVPENKYYYDDMNLLALNMRKVLSDYQL